MFISGTSSVLGLSNEGCLKSGVLSSCIARAWGIVRVPEDTDKPVNCRHKLGSGTEQEALPLSQGDTHSGVSGLSNVLKDE